MVTQDDEKQRETMQLLESSGLLEKLEREAVAERDAERARLAAELAALETEKAGGLPSLRDGRNPDGPT